MTAWILGVLGTGVIGAVVSGLTANTRVHKIVRTACVYAFVLAVIFPLPGLISGDWQALSCDGAENNGYDAGIVEVTDEAYFSLVSEALEEELKKSGYDTECLVTGTVFADKAEAESVTIKLYGEFSDSSSERVRVASLAAAYLETDVSLLSVYVGDDQN